MEPKFQSSFIPKGPVSVSAGMPSSRPARKGGLYGYVAIIIFVISLVLAAASVGYRFYVKGTINRMSEEIASKSDTLIPSSSKEFIRLNNRIKSTQALLNNHIVVSPLFDYLEASTVRSVRFTELTYNTTPSGVELILKGQASGYSAIALQADIFNRGTSFRNSDFSDLSLDEKGNVTFTYKAMLDPNLISYQKLVEGLEVPKPVIVPVATTTPVTASSTATTTAQTSTSTSSN